MQTTRNEKLQNLHNERHAKSTKLLENIKSNHKQIQQLLALYSREEPDLVYRFYHQSFKVFIAVSLVEQSNKLFVQLSPNGIPLNDWYCSIADKVVGREFNDETTNKNWLAETQPILEALWHSRYFLEQMKVAAKELKSATQILPSGWAAVLYLYNLR